MPSMQADVCSNEPPPRTFLERIDGVQIAIAMDEMGFRNNERIDFGGPKRAEKISLGMHETLRLASQVLAPQSSNEKELDICAKGPLSA